MIVKVQVKAFELIQFVKVLYHFKQYRLITV